LQRGTPGEVYNIGAGQPMTNLEIINQFLLFLHRPEGLIAFVQDRPRHHRRCALNTAKISREPAWRPAVPVEGGLGQAVGRCTRHPEWVEKTRRGQ
jgi:dTDP-glucose 4,6-dehydratase